MADYTVLGARGRISDPQILVDRLQSMKQGQALAMDAEMVCGKEHLASAVEHAMRAFHRGTSSANNIMMETMLYASGERQISKARDKMGVKPGGRSVALVLFGADPSTVLQITGLERDDTVLEASEEKLLAFGIGRRELDMMPEDQRADLVLERVAFVEVLKR
jgi:KEOPS complex subunit Cgi121